MFWYYRFPSKEQVLNYVVRVTKAFLKKQPKSLVVVGAYSIGKECVFLSISKALGVLLLLSMVLHLCNFFFHW